MYGHVMWYYISVCAWICHETCNGLLVVHMLENCADGCSNLG